MILILKQNTTDLEANQLVDRLNRMGFKTIRQKDSYSDVVSIVNGIDDLTQIDAFKVLPCVENIEIFSQPYKLSGKQIKKQNLIIDIRGKKIGGESLAVMAGPCSIESEEQIHRIAKSVAASGATILRGGVFKPRTSPYDFQGLGEIGIDYLHQAARKNNLLSITEVMDINQLETMIPKIDILQIGARNMQNFSLLKEVGKANIPVMLKRGFCATYKEFLMAAEYILASGNPNVILCERGIRTFETHTRNTLDIAAVPVLRELSHLPIIVDPSHGTGLRNLVSPMASAAVAAGADGVMVEVHYDPDRSYSDAKQALSTEDFKKMMNQLRKIKNILRNSEG